MTSSKNLFTAKHAEDAEKKISILKGCLRVLCELSGKSVFYKYIISECASIVQIIIKIKLIGWSKPLLNKSLTIIR